VVSCKKKTPLSGIFKLAHQRFFRPHGGLSALCGPGANPCYTRLGHSFYPSYHSRSQEVGRGADTFRIAPQDRLSGLVRMFVVKGAQVVLRLSSRAVLEGRDPDVGAGGDRSTVIKKKRIFDAGRQRGFGDPAWWLYDKRTLSRTYVSVTTWNGWPNMEQYRQARISEACLLPTLCAP